ncbi:MAG: sulfotransferase family protein [Pseudomonadota bacterium]
MTLDVIGPGFGRTGTNSMQLALHMLGFGPCHHMFELSKHPERPERLAFWQAVASGQRPDWDTGLGAYRSQVDWPGARYWRELCAAYPNAKVVLTTRDPETWHASICQTILSFVEDEGSHPTPHLNKIATLGRQIILEETFQGRLSDADYAIDRFNAHIAEVRETVAPSRFLLFDVREGWEPLCHFLRVPVPENPFPRENSAEDFNKRRADDERTANEPG